MVTPKAIQLATASVLTTEPLKETQSVWPTVLQWGTLKVMRSGMQMVPPTEPLLALLRVPLMARPWALLKVMRLDWPTEQPRELPWATS